PVQKKISPSKVKQNLKNMPSLIFEPELLKIRFSKEQIEEAKANHEKVPDQIDALATPEFQITLKDQLEALKLRFDQENDLNKGMMAHAIIYFMEQENALPCLNQIVVAMYYSVISDIDSNDPGVLKQLNQMLNEYDQTWADCLKEKMNASEEGDQKQLSAEETSMTEEEKSLIAPSPFEGLLKEFENYINSESSLADELKERVLEDVEVLINDYFEEQEITQLEDIRPRKIKSFLEGWFIQTMHPTKEDLETMLNSLEFFFKFSESEGKIAKETCEKILSFLKDKEAFLSILNT
ncbi:hypothetical protein KKA14_02000, partial [bacterium]|nr:hypothetical protein [bacterium]